MKRIHYDSLQLYSTLEEETEQVSADRSLREQRRDQHNLSYLVWLAQFLHSMVIIKLERTIPFVNISDKFVR